MEPTVKLRVDLRNSPYASAVEGGIGILEKTAKLSSTWKEFLTNECGLKLQKDPRRGYQDPLYVCSLMYVANPRSGTVRSQHDKGWRAGLDERIGDFITKYKRQRGMYTVKLSYCLGRGGGGGDNAAVRNFVIPGNRQGSQLASELPAPVPKPIPIYLPTQQKVGGDEKRIPSTSKSSGLAPPEQGASTSGSSNAKGDLMDIFLHDVDAKRVGRKNQKVGESSESEMDSSVDLNDALSDGTAANDERAELHAEGIQVENLIPRIMVNVHRLDNTLFLKAKKEIKRLRASGLWSKHQKRAPFVSIVIEELLREPPEGE